jgi:hypothetical protein
MFELVRSSSVLKIILLLGFVFAMALSDSKQETMELHVAGTKVVINSKGGSIDVMRGDDPYPISIKLDFLKEYKNIGKEEKVVKHPLENVEFTILEEQKNIPLLLMTGTPDFKYSKDYKAVSAAESVSSTDGKDLNGNEDLISPYSAFGSIVSFSGRLDNGSKVTIDVMIVNSMGKVGTREQSWWASSGDFNFNVHVEDWHWSDEESDILDLGICMDRVNEKWVQKEIDDNVVFSLGETTKMSLASSYYALNESGGTWQLKDFSVGYPKLVQRGGEQIFTFRFGKFGKKMSLYF